MVPTIAALVIFGLVVTGGWPSDRAAIPAVIATAGIAAYHALLPLLVVGNGALDWAVARPVTPWHHQGALFPLLALVIFPVPGFLTLSSPQTSRSLHAIPLIAVIGAVGVVTLADLVATGWRRIRDDLPVAVVPVVVAVILAAVAVESAGQLRRYFRDYAKQDQVAFAFLAGIEPAVDCAVARRTECDEIWITSTNQPDICVLFCGGWRPADYQGKLAVRRNPPTSIPSWPSKTSGFRRHVGATRRRTSSRPT